MVLLPEPDRPVNQRVRALLLEQRCRALARDVPFVPGDVGRFDFGHERDPMALRRNFAKSHVITIGTTLPDCPSGEIPLAVSLLLVIAMLTCPHCGAKLFGTNDPFCPECREPVDEPPARPRTKAEQAKVRA